LLSPFLLLAVGGRNDDLFWPGKRGQMTATAGEDGLKGLSGFGEWNSSGILHCLQDDGRNLQQQVQMRDSGLQSGGGREADFSAPQFTMKP
jgi:hypothetical protein